MTAMRRLFPDPPGPTSPDEVAADQRRRVGGRPWVGICMVSSLDGSTVLDQRSGSLGSPTDTALLGALRRAADLIIVGAGTVRAEGYGPPKKPGQRIGVVTGTGDIDVASDLFTSGAGFLIMPEDGPRARSSDAGPIETLRAGQGRVDVATALGRLGDVVASPTFVHCEGGPGLNAQLFEAGCVDELNLTIAPTVVGGVGARITNGARERPHGFTLHQLVEDGSFLFGRWRRAPAEAAGGGRATP